MPAIHDPKRVVIGPVVGNYLHVFAARSVAPGAEPKFSGQFILDKVANKGDLDRLMAAYFVAGREKWRDFDDMVRQKRVRNPFREGSEREGQPGFGANKVFINTTSPQKPGVVDANVSPILDPKEIYSGVIVRVALRAFSYDMGGNRGVSFGLQNLQKLDDGEPIGNWVRPEDDFQPVAAVDGIDSMFR
jgi:hypothetical protein